MIRPLNFDVLAGIVFNVNAENETHARLVMDDLAGDNLELFLVNAIQAAVLRCAPGIVSVNHVMIHESQVYDDRMNPAP